VVRGNTPACAGTTRASDPRPARTAEHPRVRGDDPSAPPFRLPGYGTPPRARGRLPAATAPAALRGNTPACAGTTRGGRVGGGALSEHPRVRGDDLTNTAAGLQVRGTPPRARGRRLAGQHRRRGERNTPACAGTTRPSRSTPGRGAEHPRVRGDDPGADPLLRGVPGTPPRARGRRRRASGGRPWPGNTPACAGTTGRRPTWCGPPPEHPRVRGDDRRGRSPPMARLGTPPRARGRRARDRDRIARCRNTPACAGTTGWTTAGCTPQAEHPRVRGDDAAHVRVDAVEPGTPPRARGRPTLR